jgi:hypothetical protein
MTNLILATDSYKHSHFLQYPPEARAISAYIEARANDFADEVLFIGLQPFLLDRLARPLPSRISMRPRPYARRMANLSTARAGRRSCAIMAVSCLSRSAPCPRE